MEIRVQHWQLSGRSDNGILFHLGFFLNSEVSFAKGTALLVPGSAVNAVSEHQK